MLTWLPMQCRLQNSSSFETAWKVKCHLTAQRQIVCHYTRHFDVHSCITVSLTNLTDDLSSLVSSDYVATAM
jgi:hypothetical protein